MNRMRDCVFSSIEDIVQISEVIEDGRWSPLLYEVEDVDETTLEHNSTGSDYTVKSLKAFSKANDIVGKCEIAVANLIKEGRKSVIVYLSSIDEAIQLESRLNNAIAVHSKTKKIIRDRAVESFKRGDLKVLINVGIFIEGFNYPELSAIVLARPTSSIAIYYQGIGRLVRTHPNKKNGKIVDISGNFNKFGKIEELVFEEIPYYGWAMLNGSGELLTNFPLKAKNRPTRESLIERGKQEASGKKNGINPEFTFGMFKGRKLFDIARSKDADRLKSYSSWLWEQHKKGEWKFYGKQGESLKEGIREYLKIPDPNKAIKKELPF